MGVIIVADDEKDTVDLISLVLKKDGHDIHPAYGGEDCIRAVIDKKPDLVIMDVTMPDMDGYSVASQLSQNDEARDIPILVLSGKEDLRDVFRFLPNVVDFLVKPFDVKVLRSAVASIMGRKAVL